jgi:putative oxidoreductase
MPQMASTTAAGLLLLRVSFGLMLAAHGVAKLLEFQAFVPRAGGTALAIGAILGELAGGLGLAAGFLTRLAGLGVATVMLTIAFTRQAQHLAAVGTGPGNAFEYPFLLGIVGVAFAIMGAGPFSLDARVFGPRR